MTLNKTGVTRLVFIFKNFVIKIPNFSCQWSHFLEGLLSNMREHKAYRIAKILNRDHLLCPVLWSSWGGWILIMRRVRVCSNDEQIDYSLYPDTGWDDKPSNYGYLDGRLVKIDYH